MSIKIIGITGPTGAGKTVLSDRLRASGVPCIDADKVYHAMLKPPSECLDAISSTFGKDILKADGTLDRAALGRIVFTDPEKLSLLNSTVLSIVIARVRKMISDCEREGHALVAVDAPTLIESGFNKECVRVISVIADPQRRIDRISERDGIPLDAAEARVSAQKPNEFYIEHSDTVISNDGTKARFEEKIKTVIDDILRKE